MISKLAINHKLNYAWLNFLEALSANEKKILKAKLSKGIPSYFDDNNYPNFSDTYSEEKFNILANTLRLISPMGEMTPRNGIIYRGFPSWLDSNILERLQNEAILRRDQPLDRVDHFLGCGGVVADQLSVDKRIVDFVGECVGRKVKATGIASYLYYDKPGLGIRPHVDTDVFSINMMLMLKHDSESHENSSATLIFPHSSIVECYRLKIGEVMLMYGGAVIHSRSIIQDEENICLLTIGFNQDA